MKGFGVALPGLVVLLGFVLAAPSVALAVHDVDGSERVVGPTACAQCHKQISARWSLSRHAQALEAVQQKPTVRAMASTLGIKNFLTEPRCAACHVTVSADRGRSEPVGGVTCESCHGPGYGYNKPHGEWSGKTRETETADEKARRWQRAEREGLVRPHRVYEWAKACYSCHMITDTAAVETGGHPPGNKDFALLAWLLGEVRHNIDEPAGTENRMPDRSRQRLVHVVGAAVELETGLRAVAGMTDKTPFAVGLARRTQAARTAMERIAEVLPIAETKAIVAATATVQLKLNNQAELTAAADAVAAAAQAMAETYTGETFAAVDPLLPGPEAYKGK